MRTANRKSWTIAATLFAMLSCTAAPHAAQVDATASPDRYTTVAASRNGIGKRYMGREIAGVMGWQAAAWLEREQREKEERTDLLVDALRLKPGMVVADIGAGSGYLSRRMAPAVSPGGKVLAVDVQPEMVALLQTMVKAGGVKNVVPLLGSEADVHLPASTVDMAIMVDVYHELAYPYEVLESIIRALKPGGQLVFVEFREEDPQLQIMALHKMSEAQIKREAAEHALVWDHTVRTLPVQHLVVFRKRD